MPEKKTALLERSAGNRARKRNKHFWLFLLACFQAVLNVVQIILILILFS